jgi:uncharacterized membrane protein YfcA
MEITILALGIFAVILGIFLGGRIRRGLSEARYQQGVLIFLLLTGASLVVRP